VFLDVNLLDRKDPDTWWPGIKKGLYFEIHDEYDRTLSWIMARILARVENAKG